MDASDYVDRKWEDVTLGELMGFLENSPAVSPYNGKTRILEKLQSKLTRLLLDHAQAYHKGDPGNPGPRGCMPLYPGDTVRLRSGGPLMTVLEERESVVRCAWFQGKENREGSFPAVALDREEPAWHGKD